MSRSAPLAASVLFVIAAGGCAPEWGVALQVDLAGLATPETVFFMVEELDEAGATLQTETLTLPGAAVVPVPLGGIPEVMLRMEHAAASVRVMVTANDASGVPFAGATGTFRREPFVQAGSLVLAPFGPPTVPVPLLPRNTTATTSDPPLFRWLASSGGAGLITYDLQWSADDQFSSPGFLTTENLEVTPTAPLGAGRWFWRLRACAVGLCSDYSTPTYYVDVGYRPHDLDRDTLEDAVAGGPGYQTDQGAFVVVDGNATMVAGFSQVLVGTPAAMERFSGSIAFAGDLNHDGAPDVVAGADGGALARVYYGPAVGGLLSSVADGVLSGQALGGFGFSVAAAGDVDVDGFADLLVGAPFDDGGGMDAGAAYLFRGGDVATFDAAPDLILFGLMADDEVGTSVAGVGDVNGDGYPDIAIGGRQGGLTPSRGVVYVLYMSGTGTDLDDEPDAMFTGTTDGDAFGSAIAGGGDLDGDSYADMAVGAPGRAGGGAVYLYRGGLAGPVLAATIEGLPSAGGLGASLSMAGDVNGDGLDDLVAGAPSTMPGGRVYVFYGEAGSAMLVDPTDATVIDSPSAAIAFGTAVTIAGDMNGDDAADVMVGGPACSCNSLTENGVLYLYYGAGGVMINTTADATIFGGMDGDALGSSLD
jgi:hypothetical protein